MVSALKKSRFSIFLSRTLGRTLGGTLRRAGATEAAIILLVMLALVLAVATALEGTWGRERVQQQVYGSLWFRTLFGLLGVNILAAMLIRIPWNRHQIGFVMTHLGLLVVLVGMAQSFLGGMEGRMTLERGAAASSVGLTQRGELEVTQLSQNARQRCSFSLLETPVDLPCHMWDSALAHDDFRVRVLRIDFSGSSTPSAAAEFNDASFATSRCTVLVELRWGGSTHQVLLERGGERRTIKTADGPVSFKFVTQHLPLGFSIELLDFRRTTNPGGTGDASVTSRIRLVDDLSSVVREADISINEPMSHKRFKFYHIGYRQSGDGTETVILGVARDPGQKLKYIGLAAVCLGATITFLTRKPCRREYRESCNVRLESKSCSCSVVRAP